MRHLVWKGFAQRLRRGLYQVVPQRETGRRILPAYGASDMVESLFSPCYLGGWTAAEEWDLDAPDTAELFVVTAKRVRRCRVEIGGVEIRLTHAPLGLVQGPGIERGPRQPPISNLERTIVDGLVNPAWLGGVKYLVHALKHYSDEAPDDFYPFLDLLREAGSGAAVKRLGFLVSRHDLSGLDMGDELLPLRTKGVIDLEPGGRKEGRINRRWGVRENARTSCFPDWALAFEVPGAGDDETDEAHETDETDEVEDDEGV
jgi:predicted transcriptional regulator of viral defense system